MPDYLKPGNLFLGQYMIKDILTYRRILTEKMMNSVSVFDLSQLTPKSPNSVYKRDSDVNPKDQTSRTLVHSTASKDTKLDKITTWKQYCHYLYLQDFDYSFRAKTESIFMDKQPFIFDFFVVDDIKFEQYYLYQNLWRETLLLAHFDDARIAKVKDFG